MGYQSSYNKVPGHKFGAQSSKLGCTVESRFMKDFGSDQNLS